MNGKRMLPKNTIDWGNVWSDFDSWLARMEKPEECKTCGHSESRTPDWEEQQIKIGQLVNAQVRKIMKKKT